MPDLTYDDLDQWQALCEWIEAQADQAGAPPAIPAALAHLTATLSQVPRPRTKGRTPDPARVAARQAQRARVHYDLIHYQPNWGWRVRPDWRERLAYCRQAQAAGDRPIPPYQPPVGNAAFGHWLAEQRKTHGLRQEHLAKALSASKRVIEDLEQGRRRLKPDNTAVLFAAIDLDPTLWPAYQAWALSSDPTPTLPATDLGAAPAGVETPVSLPAASPPIAVQGVEETPTLTPALEGDTPGVGPRYPGLAAADESAEGALDGDATEWVPGHATWPYWTPTPRAFGTATPPPVEPESIPLPRMLREQWQREDLIQLKAHGSYQLTGPAVRSMVQDAVVSLAQREEQQAEARRALRTWSILMGCFCLMGWGAPQPATWLLIALAFPVGLVLSIPPWLAWQEQCEVPFHVALTRVVVFSGLILADLGWVLPDMLAHWH